MMTVSVLCDVDDAPEEPDVKNPMPASLFE